MQTDLTPAELAIRKLGRCQVASPLAGSNAPDAEFVKDDARIVLSVETSLSAPLDPTLGFEKAGPRQQIFFDPAQARVGIVTCGGACPGLNSVIRSLVLELYHWYGVKRILGFRYGYEGLNPEQGLPPLELTPEHVESIHEFGGSMLGLGRSRQSVELMLDRLIELGIDALFTVGGDGTLSGAHAIAELAERRGVRLAVVGVPKTIDNDVPFVDQTFGFDTAIEIARQALHAAHSEAHSARNGVGLVKLMGREAGFIAAHATLASGDVNFCLIPEVPFALEGSAGLLETLERRLAARDHAVVVIAEGCRSVWPRLGAAAPDDVGTALKDVLLTYFASRNFPATVKYIDPSYMIRSVAANSSDHRYSDQLARHAAHAALAGKTDLVVGRCNGAYTHVPLQLVTSRKRRVDPSGDLWRAVTSSTGQRSLLLAPA
jgi:6-phosphofructokinase 1